MSEPNYLIYGAYGYTGELIAREAVARGQRPILGGRDREKVEALAAELTLPHRSFSLDDPATVAAGLDGMAAVLHCAGPFERTAKPMVRACLETGTHYLDITGEMAVFEALAALDGKAREAGVMLLPGAGFDVVPTDCLAAHLARRLPGATELELGFQALGRLSRGTATTMIENLGRGGAVRREGKITPVPTAWKSREIDFAGPFALGDRGAGPRQAVTIPWGDVSTAWHSTGIPNITVWLAAGPSQLRVMKLTRWLGPLLSLGPVKGFLKRRVRSGAPGPNAEERARGRSFVWGEVRDGEGHRAISRLAGPEGYSFTVLTALEAVGRVLAAQTRPGFATPSLAFGADFVLGIPGVERRDEA